MQDRKWSRRDWLKVTAATAAGMVFAEPLRAAAPPAEAVTPELIAAAKKEGKISFYSALELNTAERLARDFEQKYPGISVRVERSGAERIFQRIAQEQGSGKKNDWLAAYVPEDVARHFPADQIDPDGTSATSCAWFEVIGYNTDQVKREEAPKSYADLLDPKWRGKIVKGHPSYSGAIMTATFVLARDLGWPYLEKLSQQRVMQVQSAADPPKKILLGERAVMADGNDYNLVLAKDQGKPVEVVYPTEGAPLIIVPSGIFKNAPNPNAARLFQSYFFSAETQQMLADEFAHRSFHAKVKEKAGHVPLDKLKMLKADPAQVQVQSEEIKAKYAKLFRV
ncbi:ABC transporter substrate-binding protein [Bradyrhizobium elkanii]|uniref:ABC transporter substrate-binding protein n=1 Tax=Bradyrhizobium elkanii TaxID=29448 RepID=UPI003D21938C